jgi:hypothetical protein
MVFKRAVLLGASVAISVRRLSRAVEVNRGQYHSRQRME